jgi:prophage regulatory protein
MTGTTPKPHGKRFLRVPDVIAKIGLSKPTLYRMLKAEEFPQPIVIRNSNLWPEEAVDSWMEAQVEAQAVQPRS